MSPVARGALLYTMLPRWPKRATAHQLQARLAEQGIAMHVRSIQRDLKSMPPGLVVASEASKPFGWARVAPAPQGGDK